MSLSEHDCRICEERALSALSPMERAFAQRFVVCKTCGNKRCPKASWHENECTNSNDDGQPGSFYGPRESWPLCGVEKETKE